MMSASNCSIRRFVSLMAVSARSFEQPMPTSLSGWPLIEPPVQPSRGLFLFFGFAPAYWDIAETTPARSWLSNAPNAPWQSERTAILIVDAVFRAVAADAASAATATRSSAKETTFHLRLATVMQFLPVEPTDSRPGGLIL